MCSCRRRRVYNYNLILISASYYYAPCMALALVLCMIRERHVILKVALHSRLYSCLAAASCSYIIMLCCLVYIFFFLLLLVYSLKINNSLGNLYNYSYIYLPSFPSSCIVHNYDNYYTGLLLTSLLLRVHALINQCKLCWNEVL